MYKAGCTSWIIAFDNPTNEHELRKAYTRLAKLYHEDSLDDEHKDMGEEFKNISKLYADGVKYFKIKTDTGDIGDILKIRNSHDKGLDFKYMCEDSVGGAAVFTGRSSICLKFMQGDKIFFDNFIRAVKDIKYPNEVARKSLELCIPNILKTFEAVDGYYIIVGKTEEQISLGDILRYYETTKTEWKDKYRHSVWIMNRLYNMVCLMEYNNISFSGLTLDNIYVSPLYHTISLLNGWQFCTNIGDKMIGTTPDVYSIIPLSDKKIGKSTLKIDLESIKLIGRKLFNGEAPEEFKELFRLSSSVSAQQDWKVFEEITSKVYGHRKFYVFDIDVTDVLLTKHLK